MNDLAKNTSQLTPIEVLLKVEDDGTIFASNVYKFLKLNLAHYSRWCKVNISENEFAEENVDYTPFTINGECGGQASKDFKLSIPFAKKLCMKQGNERGEEARDYFIKVEELHKETKLTLNGLSPQLQLLINMELKQNEMEKQLSLTTEKVSTVESKLSVIQDTIIQRDVDWRKSLNKMFNNAVEASGERDFQALRKLSYEILEERAHCDLNKRLRNLHERLEQNGSTKTQINKTGKLDVIEGVPQLKEIYTSIIKELSIHYISKEVI